MMMDEKGNHVQAMFADIANRYDFMNWVMTFGQDSRWRKYVICRLSIPENGTILDLGTGTGDLAGEALARYPKWSVVATDFTLEMMSYGKARSWVKNNETKRLNWNAADAHHLPFANNLFDAVVSGFLLRNVSDLESCLKETYRILKPGGMMVALDTTPPKRSLLFPLVDFYMNSIIPVLGKIFTKHGEAYRYLPGSTNSFLEPEKLSARLNSSGFRNIGYKRLMFNTIAVYWCRKPFGD